MANEADTASLSLREMVIDLVTTLGGIEAHLAAGPGAAGSDVAREIAGLLPKIQHQISGAVDGTLHVALEEEAARKRLASELMAKLDTIANRIAALEGPRASTVTLPPEFMAKLDDIAARLTALEQRPAPKAALPAVQAAVPSDLIDRVQNTYGLCVKILETVKGKSETGDKDSKSSVTSALNNISTKIGVMEKNFMRVEEGMTGFLKKCTTVIKNLANETHVRNEMEALQKLHDIVNDDVRRAAGVKGTIVSTIPGIAEKLAGPRPHAHDESSE